jgi:hypothetical protein
MNDPIILLLAGAIGVAALLDIILDLVTKPE